MNEVAQGPVAVQTPQENVPASGVGVAPPTNNATPHDPAVDVFAKIAAERRTRFGQEPVAVPFGSHTIRIHRSMPASFAIDLANATTDPGAAITALRSAIVESDKETFEKILRLPPDNAEGIDGTFLLEFISALGEFYAGVPLGAS